MEKRNVDVVVLSDIHLGTYACKAKELVSYLKSITPSVLILNGDIIDSWQFSKSYFPPTHMAVIKEILNMIMTGTRVFYITGNHDEILRRYTDFFMGNFTLTDKLVLEINHKKIWIFHGDVFDNTTKGCAKILAKLGSNGYGLLILLNRMINWLLTHLGQERISLSKRIMEGVNKAVAQINDFEQIAADLAIQKKFDFVICGHLHQPQHREIQNAHGSVTYLNSGDWVENLTSLEYFKNTWKIYTYEEKKFQEYKIDKPMQPVVVTDEINFHINSLAI